jgi:hypothetical protein
MALPCHAAFEEKTLCQSLQHLLNTTDRFNARWDQFTSIFDGITMVLHLPTKLSSLWFIKVFLLLLLLINMSVQIR